MDDTVTTQAPATSSPAPASSEAGSTDLPAIEAGLADIVDAGKVALVEDFNKARSALSWLLVIAAVVAGWILGKVF